VAEQLKQREADGHVPIDPDAVDHAYRLHRARRRVRVERTRRRRWAGARFWIVFLLLAAAAVFLALTTWREIARLFGV